MQTHQFRPRTADGRPKTELVYEFLRDHEGEHFSPTLIAEATGLNYKQVANALRQLAISKRRPGIEHDAYGAYTWRDPGPTSSVTGLPWLPPTGPSPKHTHPLVRGGFDGLVLSFGEDADENTLSLFLGPVFAEGAERWPYTIDLHLADGSEHLVRGIRTGRNEDGFMTITCTVLDEETAEPTGEEFTIDFEQVVGIYIY